MDADAAKPSSLEDMLERLAAGGLGALSSLRESIDMSLEEVARWFATPPNAETIRNLAMLLDAQTQLMICQYRLLAVAKLAEVMTTAKGPETIRRAAKDMLTINVFGPRAFGRRSRGGPEPEPEPQPPEPSSEEILKWLSQFSSWEEFEAAGPGGQPAGHGGPAQPAECNEGAPRRAQTNPPFSRPPARADRALGCACASSTPKRAEWAPRTRGRGPPREEPRRSWTK